MPAEQDFFDMQEPNEAADGARVPAARQGSDEPAQVVRPVPEPRGHHSPGAAAPGAVSPPSLDGGSGLVDK